MERETRTRPLARRALAAQSDERLVRLFCEGHEAAFEEIVGRYQRPLIAFSAAIIPFHRAEDVVQASLLKAHDALLAEDRGISLRAWLFTIVRNGSLNVVRDDPDWQELDPSYDSVPQPAAIAEQNEELEALVTAICALPEEQREALVARELAGDGHAEIAARLETSTTAVRGLIFRARTALRNALGAAIPLPLLRLLLVEAPVVGAAGAGVGAATVGGGTKLAAALSVGAIALGGGVAIEQERGNDSAAAAAASERTEGDTGSAGDADASPGGTEADPLAMGAGGDQARSVAARGGGGDRSPGQRDSGGGETGVGAGAGDPSQAGPGGGGPVPDGPGPGREAFGPGPGPGGGGGHGGPVPGGGGHPGGPPPGGADGGGGGGGEHDGGGGAGGTGGGHHGGSGGGGPGPGGDHGHGTGGGAGDHRGAPGERDRRDSAEADSSDAGPGHE